jgi:hypothetical protein
MADMMVGFDLASFFDDGTFVEVPDGESPPEGREGSEYVMVGSRRELHEMACASAYQDMALPMMQPTHKPRLRERAVKKAVRTYLGNLMEPEAGTDLTNLTASPLPTVWVLRTRGPGGNLLYPRWVGENQASEAHLRAQLVGAAWFTHA